MSLPDGAEYWWPVFNVSKNFLKDKRKYPKHMCGSRNVPIGTPFKWFCPICHKRVKKGTLVYQEEKEKGV